MKNHGSKRTLSAEIVALRKQVNDLKEAALVRRRVEDALRQSGELYRAIVEDAPVGLAYVPEARQPLCINAIFAASLGYSDVAEFRMLAALRQVFATDEDRTQLVSRASAAVQVMSIQLRRRDGAIGPIRVLVRRSSDGAGVVLASTEVPEEARLDPRRGASADAAADPESDPSTP